MDAAKSVVPLTRRQSSNDLVKEMDVMESIRTELHVAPALNYNNGQGLLGIHICPLCFRRVEVGAERLSDLGCGHQQARVHKACYQAMPHRVCVYCREDVKKLPLSTAMVKLMMENMARSQQNRAMQVAATRAIALLAYQNKAYVELFEQYNGCKLVCEAAILFSDDEELMAHALEAIISLCYGNTHGRKLLGQFDAPSMAVAALRFFGDKPRMQLKALTAIAKLCSTDTANILLVEWAGGCEAIVKAIRASSTVKEVVMRGLLAIKVLALYDLHSDSPLVEAGGHKLMGQILTAHETDRDLVWVCLHVLACMASTPVSCELLETAGASKDIAKFMALYAKDGNIQIQCCRGIAAMSVWSDELRDRIGDQTCRLLVKALKNWPTSPPFLVAGFRAVECLTQPSQSGDINAAFFGEKGVAVLILATVQHYITPEHRELCYTGLKGGAGFEGIMVAVGRAHRTDKEFMEQHARLQMYMRNGQGGKQKVQWGAVAGVLYKMSFARTARPAPSSDVNGRRTSREVSASGSPSMFMGLLNRPRSSRDRDVSRSGRGSVSSSGTPGLMIMQGGHNEGGSPGGHNGIRGLLGLSFARPAMLLRAGTNKSMSVSPVLQEEGPATIVSTTTTPRTPRTPRNGNGSPKKADETESGTPKGGGGGGGLLGLAMGTFGNLMNRVMLRRASSVSSTPSRPLPPTAEDPPAPRPPPDEPDNDPKTSNRLNLGAYGGEGQQGASKSPRSPREREKEKATKGPMTVEQRQEGGPVDPALEALGLSGWDAMDLLKEKKNLPGAPPPPTAKGAGAGEGKKPKAPSPKPGGSSPKKPPPSTSPANSPAKPDKPASGGLGLAARFFGGPSGGSKVSPAPTPTSTKAPPSQAPSTSPKPADPPSSLQQTNSNGSMNNNGGGGDKPTSKAQASQGSRAVASTDLSRSGEFKDKDKDKDKANTPPAPSTSSSTPKYLQKTAAYSARTANLIQQQGQQQQQGPTNNTGNTGGPITGAGAASARANMSSTDRARQRD